MQAQKVNYKDIEHKIFISTSDFHGKVVYVRRESSHYYLPIDHVEIHGTFTFA